MYLKHLNVKVLLDYSILYLKTDICHLSDVFQKFPDFAYETYNLDPRHTYTLPGFSWQSMLKRTKIELELISDSNMYLFFNGYNTRWYLSSKQKTCKSG